MQFVTPEFYIFQSHWLWPLKTINLYKLLNYVFILISWKINKNWKLFCFCFWRRMKSQRLNERLKSRKNLCLRQILKSNGTRINWKQNRTWQRCGNFCTYFVLSFFNVIMWHGPAFSHSVHALFILPSLFCWHEHLSRRFFTLCSINLLIVTCIRHTVLVFSIIFGIGNFIKCN